MILRVCHVHRPSSWTSSHERTATTFSRRSMRSTYWKENPAKIYPSVPQLDLRANRGERGGWAALRQAQGPPLGM